ncbi:MAG: ATP-dependent 6-phosphofructokinase [bacterium]
MAKKHVGILTGGGDCPGINAVVRAVTKTALRMGWDVTGFKDGYAGLVESRAVQLRDSDVSGILTRGGTILGTSNTANPFAYTLEPLGNREQPKDLSDLALKNFESRKLNALVAIGGDGTMAISVKLLEKGIPVVGVPKTIDNDLAATDITFGFDSALAVATEGVDRVHTTAESHHRVMVVETMGRYAGWIALRAGIAGGGDVILIPEIPYSDEAICRAVRNRSESGKRFSIIVAAEGAVSTDGKMSVRETVKGSPDPVRLGGVAYRIAGAIEHGCSTETRVVVLGHLQRGGEPTAYDRWLATRYGVKAVELIADGKTGHMAALRGTEVVSVSISDAASRLRRVDPEGEEVRAALSVGTSFGI